MSAEPIRAGPRRIDGRNGDNGIEKRLREVEKLLERIDERTNSFATREDVMRVKLWVASGVAGGIVTLALIGLGILRLFNFFPSQLPVQ